MSHLRNGVARPVFFWVCKLLTIAYRTISALAELSLTSFSYHS